MATRLVSYGAQWLMEQVIDPPTWLVDGLLPTSSTNLVCSPPKYGKSIFCLQLGHCVATGQPFLERPTVKAGVCYLCLEDQKYRLQRRLWALTDETSDDFRLVEQAATLSTGLIDQMEGFLRDFPDTKLFIVDTLQVTRDKTADYSYASDYADLRQFKSFADRHDLCLLIVHHLRKAESTSDQFMDISGTTAISGAVDGMMVMKKDSRDSTDCCLPVTGRDIEYGEIIIRRNGMRWELVGQRTEAEAIEERIPDAVKTVVNFIRSSGVWSGPSTALIAQLALENITPAKLGKQLSQHHEWMAAQGVHYFAQRTSSTRTITLAPIAHPQP